MVLRFALSFPEDIDDVSSDMTRYYAGVFVFLMGYRLQYGIYPFQKCVLGEIQTRDLPLRKWLLYLAELRKH